VIQFERFDIFITSQWGLDTTLTMIEHICEEDIEALDLLDWVTTQTRGGVKNPTGKNQHTKEDAGSQDELFAMPDGDQVNHDNITPHSPNQLPIL